MKTKAAVVSTGWVGDTIACTAAADCLSKNYSVDFYYRWPQLTEILKLKTNLTPHLYNEKFLFILKLKLTLNPYEKVIWEPFPWSYKEPFTAEIRRLSGCSPATEYNLNFPSRDNRRAVDKKTITISKDIYKRAYGRNIEKLLISLSAISDIKWVGLDPEVDSKKGRKTSLYFAAETIADSDLFIGPEGGMLWLAAGLNVPTIYFTEHIDHICNEKKNSSVFNSLGPANMFSENHTALPVNCSNEFAIEAIKKALQHNN